jgi:CheY-like chemotaxis protein
MRTLIIEDKLSDTRIAAHIARAEGFEDIEAFTSLHEAIERIEQGLRGERPLPDAIILDLNLGHENGYEALLQWRTTWADSAMRMVVWSALGEHNAQLCALFHVDAFVSKWKGEAALHEALREVVGKRPEAT